MTTEWLWLYMECLVAGKIMTELTVARTHPSAEKEGTQ